MGVSVVIPTWNEELWLPRLLASLGDISDIDEILVIDNESGDNTVPIAKANGCTTATGGRPGKARNVGARMSNGDVIVFIDADAIVNRQVIARVKSHFSVPGVAAVHFPLRPISPTPFIRACYAVMEQYLRLVPHFGISQGVGSFVAVRKSAFLAVGGFRENVEVGEDADLYRRLASIGSIKYDRDLAVYVSARRFFLERPLVFAAKCLFWSALRLSRSTASVIGYQWRPYPAFAAERENLFVRELLNR